MENVLTGINVEEYIDSCKGSIGDLKKKTYTKVNVVITKTLLEELKENEDKKTLKLLNKQKSDTVRSLTSMIIGFDNNKTINKKLENIKSFATDEHYSVR